jgi:alkanesulfonate monooxygenase SsuD/methylene tetrahydromethanopterin reductase-like flavin-dependent oxidoreductase (luciferase family)
MRTDGLGRLGLPGSWITTAKEIASVDHLSGGRLAFGVGAGWNREEMRNHVRIQRMRSSV